MAPALGRPLRSNHGTGLQLVVLALGAGLASHWEPASRRLWRKQLQALSGISGSGCGLVLPVGPLCPYRSDFWNGDALDSYAGAMPAKQKRLAELMMKMQMGQMLEPDEKTEACDEMQESNDMWLATNLRLRYAEDFQAQEFFKFIEVKLKQEGLSYEMVEALMKWQPQQMRAVLQQQPPPPMPPGLNPASMQQLSQKLPSVMNFMAPEVSITAPPFAEGCEALKSSIVKDELEALSRDHANLVSFGKGYRGFDPLGKLAFLDQLDMIEDRWKVFIGRFQLMGEMNPRYLEETEAYLKRAGITIDDFNAYLSSSHKLMREEAEQEGLRR